MSINITFDLKRTVLEKHGFSERFYTEIKKTCSSQFQYFPQIKLLFCNFYDISNL